MGDPLIPGGYYLKARCIAGSDVARSSPTVRELWDYLLRNANHSDARYAGYTIERGQLFRTLEQIRDDLSWSVGFRKERYSEDAMKKAMKKLRSLLMISSMKAPGGVLITVCNYSKYQDPANYEGTNEGTNEGTKVAPGRHQGGTHNKKKENKEEEEVKTTPRAKTRAPVVARPEDVSETVWTDFLTLRKRKRAPVTATALAGIVTQADKAGYTLEKALAECSSRGWAGFKAEWVKSSSDLPDWLDEVAHGE